MTELDDLTEDATYRVRMSGRALMHLAHVLSLSIEADTESATEQATAGDAASYHAALAAQHEAIVALLAAEEEGE